MTDAERQAALEAIASEIRACTRCRLHQGRSNAVPGEGSAATEVLFVGEGPGFNEDRLGRPFVGRAGDKLTEWIGSIGWRRQDVFITNIVKCRPPDNRDPLPDEIAACTPYLRRQIEALDPAVVVTLGRFSMGWFTPGTRISQVHGTARLADPSTGAPEATAYAMYHPAAALRSPEVDRQAAEDMVGVPTTLVAARERRAARAASGEPTGASAVDVDAATTLALEGEPSTVAAEVAALVPEAHVPAGAADVVAQAASPTVEPDLVAQAASPTVEPDLVSPAPGATSADPVAEPRFAASAEASAGEATPTLQAPSRPDAGRPTNPDSAARSRLPSSTSGADRPSEPSPMSPAAQGPGPRADDVPSDQLTLF